jgi:hypothetical protein
VCAFCVFALCACGWVGVWGRCLGCGGVCNSTCSQALNELVRPSPPIFPRPPPPTPPQQATKGSSTSTSTSGGTSSSRGGFPLSDAELKRIGRPEDKYWRLYLSRGRPLPMTVGVLVGEWGVCVCVLVCVCVWCVDPIVGQMGKRGGFLRGG